MEALQINTAFATQRMSTDKGFTALKDFTQAELLTLGIEARKSNNPALLRCFVGLPLLADLVAAKVTVEQQEVVIPVSKTSATPTPQKAVSIPPVSASTPAANTDALLNSIES